MFDRFQFKTWLRRGLMIGTVLLIIIYGYLFLTGLNSVPAELRSDLLNAQEKHLNHNHKEALEDLKPFSRFEKYEYTAFYERASHLRDRLENVLERQDTIREGYREAMKHKVTTVKQLNPSSVPEKLTALEQQLNRLWTKHQNFLKKHEETAAPYSETTSSMLELLLHRLIRLESSTDPSYIRLFKYKTRIYSSFLEQAGQKVENSGETPYRNILAYVNSTISLVENTAFEPKAKQIRQKLRRKIADHFDRIDQNYRQALKENDYDQAEDILNEHQGLFKDISPWAEILENRIKSIRKLQQLKGS